MISLHETGKYVLRLDGRSGKQLLFEPDLGNHVAAGVWRCLVELGGLPRLPILGWDSFDHVTGLIRNDNDILLPIHHLADVKDKFESINP